MNIRPARLDRQRQAQCARDFRRGRAIGIKELRIDQIKRAFGVELSRDRQHGARDQRRVPPRAQRRDQRKSRAQHLDPSFYPIARRAGQRGITTGDHWGQADRVDNGDLPIATRGQRLELARNERAEGGALGVGVERGDAKQVAGHAQKFVTACGPASRPPPARPGCRSPPGAGRDRGGAGRCGCPGGRSSARTQTARRSAGQARRG